MLLLFIRASVIYSLNIFNRLMEYNSRIHALLHVQAMGETYKLSNILMMNITCAPHVVYIDKPLITFTHYTYAISSFDISYLKI